MVTREWDPSDSWPRDRQSTSPAVSGIPDNDRHLASGEALDKAADLAQVAEAALAPDEIDTGESLDDTVRRLLADKQIVEAIIAEGLDGNRLRELQNELIRYAEPVLHQLLLDGRIISKCTKLRRPPGDTEAWLEFTRADRAELARDMIADAMPVFTKAVFEMRTWSPDPNASRKTATLKTYFVNGCALQFPRLYQKWIKQRREQPAGLQPALDIVEAARGPSEIADLDDEASRLLRSIPDPQVREFLALRMIGYKTAEAAQRAGLTERAAENKLARIKRAMRKKPDPHPVTGDGTPATEDGGCSDTQKA